MEGEVKAWGEEGSPDDWYNQVYALKNELASLYLYYIVNIYLLWDVYLNMKRQTGM